MVTKLTHTVIIIAIRKGQRKRVSSASVGQHLLYAGEKAGCPLFLLIGIEGLGSIAVDAVEELLRYFVEKGARYSGLQLAVLFAFARVKQGQGALSTGDADIAEASFFFDISGGANRLFVG